jgi:beta-galactosidase GanA
MTTVRRRRFFRPATLVAVLAGCSVAITLPAQVKERPIPQVIKKDGRYGFMVDGAPYLMLGAQAHNSSGWPAMLPKVWPAIESLHANTLEIPIYWEQFEPKQGQFDYTVIDTIVTQAREHHIRLDLLWFGTWKNGSQHYMPEWMKADPARYSHLIDKNGRPADSPSPFCSASQELDIRAFTAFMRHLKAFDPQRTVIIVQVENESGTWGSVRDYSPAAQKLFDGPVPPDVLKAMGKQGGASATWQEAFGPEAEVNFHAWAVATYVGKVAAAGKAVYPLPLYANAALRDPIKPGAPGSYEAGGPTDNVIPIWKVAAPAIDIVSPDIYMNDPVAYLKVLELYHRDDNALFIPETSSSSSVARFFFSALGLQAIGFSPFGLDYSNNPSVPATAPAAAPAGTPAAAPAPMDQFAPTAQNYRLIAPMMRDIARLNFEGKLQAVAEETGKPANTLAFGKWNATVSYGAGRNNRAPAGNREPTGRALVAQLADDRFLVAGYSCRVDFRPAAADKRRQFMRVDEGTYENGVFKFIRILNGDETDNGLNLRAEPIVLRVSLGVY